MSVCYAHDQNNHQPLLLPSPLHAASGGLLFWHYRRRRRRQQQAASLGKSDIASSAKGSSGHDRDTELAGSDGDALLSYLNSMSKSGGAPTCVGTSNPESPASPASPLSSRSRRQAGVDVDPWQLQLSDLVLHQEIGRGSFGRVSSVLVPVYAGGAHQLSRMMGCLGLHLPHLLRRPCCAPSSAAFFCRSF